MNKEGEVKTTTADWLKVDDSENSYTIENFPFQSGINQSTTQPHCVTCVAVNKCWFNNEKEKKPQPKRYTFQIIRKLLEIFGLDMLLGLYHPFCHCQELPISHPISKKIKTIVPQEKAGWMIKDKMHTIKVMGYTENDINEVYLLILELSKEAYCKGDYKIRQIDKYGCAVTIFLDFPGKNEKQGRFYRMKTGWMIYPEGAIKNNTLIGGLV